MNGIECLASEMEFLGPNEHGVQQADYAKVHLAYYDRYQTLCGLGCGTLFIKPQPWDGIGEHPGVSCRECLAARYALTH